MNVAINGLLLGKQESGVERCIRGLVKGLDESDKPEEALLFVGLGFDDSVWTPQRVKLHRTWVPHKFRAMRIIYDQMLFPVVSRLRKADLLHCPGYIVPFFGGAPSVVTVYDLIALKHPKLCKKSNALHFQRMLPRSVHRARRVIVPTEAVKRDVVNILKTPEDKIRVVPPGIDEIFSIVKEEEKQQIREKYDLPKKFILFVGNIEPKKNLEMLIKVFFALKMDKQLDHKLVLVGKKGWKFKGVFDLVRHLDFEEHVIFTDYVPLEELPAIYNLADCFAFPSLAEGFGIPPLEAMACGTPVVTSEDPALLETTGDSALHAPADNKKNFRESLERVIFDRSVRRHLREAGLKHAAEFTWKRYAEQTVQVYREVLGLEEPAASEKAVRET